MSKGENWFIIRHAVTRALCETAAREILGATPEVRKIGYNTYKPTPTCIKIADYVREVG